VDSRLLPDLLVFLEVARQHSISQAARRLHTVQTNVSARMQKLEAALGEKLLIRNSRGVELTLAGEKLLPAAQRLCSLLGQIGAAFPVSEKSFVLRIGSLETFAATHIAKLVGGYKKVDPRVEYTIQTGSSRSLMRMLSEAKLDLAFVSYSATTEPLRTELVIEQELVLLVPRAIRDPNLPLPGDLPLIVQRPACSYSERYLSYLEANNLPVPKVIEAGSIEALLELVEQGLGIAIAPRSLSGRRARRIRIMSLVPLGAKRWVAIHLISNLSTGNGAVKPFIAHCCGQKI
jgi:LysR family transcriptional regulator, cell division regulator